MAVELLVGEKVKGETKNAVIACNDYLRMGVGRSLASLLKIYANRDQSRPPTRHISTLKKWSAAYNWQERAETYDAAIDAERTALADARRKEVMESGLALEYERVDKLKKLAALLETQISYSPREPDADFENWSDSEFEDVAAREVGDPRVMYPLVWVKDVKGIGKGDDFARVEIVRFNTPLISEYRAALADIAAETGGRKQKAELEHTGKGGAPIAHKVDHSIDSDTAANIFDILTAAGAFGAVHDDTKDDGVHPT